MGQAQDLGHLLSIDEVVDVNLASHTTNLHPSAAEPYGRTHSVRCIRYFVARQLGHDARLTLSRYGHVIDELEDAPRLEAEVAIEMARRLIKEQIAVGGAR